MRVFAGLLLLLLFSCTLSCRAEITTFGVEHSWKTNPSLFPVLSFKDSTTSNVHSPKRATIYSAILPGLGQVYNKNYFKAFLFDAALVTSTIIMLDNRDKLRDHREDLEKLTDNDTSTMPLNNPSWTENRHKAERDFRLDNRNYAIVAMAAIYALNILDANVSGHLYQFNINQNLSARITPQFQMNGYTGLGFSLNF